jgi:pyruvate dehydrogenase E1 component
LKEVLVACDMLKIDWEIDAEVWNVTSFSELRKDAENIKRWNMMHTKKDQKKSYLETCITTDKIPTIAVSDYVKLVTEQIGPYVPGEYYALGTDGFGRSDTRENLRHFFEVDRYYIILFAVRALVNNNKLDETILNKVIKKYDIDINKPNPLSV